MHVSKLAEQTVLLQLY